MKLILIVNDRLRFFYLPKVVKNNYWITYLDDNGLEQNLINIEAIDGKWQIINNNDTYCVSNNNVSNVLLREYQVYFLKTYFQQDYLILFCLPDLEMQIGTYDISTITDKEITIYMQSRLATVASTCFYLHASPTAIRTLRISGAARSVEARLPSLPTGIYMVIFYRPCRPSIRHLPADVQAPYTPQGLLHQVSHGT